MDELSRFIAETPLWLVIIFFAVFDTDVSAAGNYLYTTATGAIYYRALSSESEGNEGFGANARIRPVVTVTINKE